MNASAVCMSICLPDMFISKESVMLRDAASSSGRASFCQPTWEWWSVVVLR